MTSTHEGCDRVQLRSILADTMTDEEFDSVSAHVAECSRCRETLESMAGSKEQWEYAVQGANRTASDSPSNHPRGRLAWADALALHLFDAPSHPEMLGQLGRYAIEQAIGVGGMGVVYRAFDTELNRSVAIKFLTPLLQNQEDAKKRFAREARAAAAVVNPHVVPIYDVQTDVRTPYLVMQYVHGESLQKRIDRLKQLRLDEILRISLQVTTGLAAAHDQGLIHRDIKPANVLLENGVDRALLTDFGLAISVSDVRLTATGLCPGTPHFMSPEQVTGLPIDRRSDLFSLGSLIYTMCTGQPPFQGSNQFELVAEIQQRAALPVATQNPEIPVWLSEIIGRLHAKDAKSRFNSAHEVQRLLEAGLRHTQQNECDSLPSCLQEFVSKSPPTTALASRHTLSNWRTTMKSIVIGSVATAVALLGAAALLPTEALGTMMLWISEDTEYASGFSQAAFDSIELGADEASVREALGVPIREYESIPSENWFYLMNPPNRELKRREDLRGTETYTSLQFDEDGLFVDLFCQMVFQGETDQAFVEPRGIGRFFAGYEFTTISSPFNNGLNTLQLSEEDIETLKRERPSKRELKDRFGAPTFVDNDPAVRFLCYSHSPSSSDYRIRKIGIDRDGKVCEINRDIYFD